MGVIQVNIQVSRYEEEGSQVTAFCDELGLAGFGHSREGAERNLKKVVLSFCRSLKRQGKLGSALDEAGIPWKEVDDNLSGPIFV